MSDKSKIQWTDATWNPVRGCSKVSAGCTHCYAERQLARFSGPGGYAHGFMRDGRWTGRVELVEEKLLDPLRWRRPRRVFVNSTSDLFHEGLPDEAIARVFETMARCPQHTFQVLTKRPERMQAWTRSHEEMIAGRWPLPNVWLGVSVEDQASADERIPLLFQTPAAIRFASVEPLIGPVRPQSVVWWRDRAGHGRSRALDWLIIGGESGPGARPCDIGWIRSIVGECQTASVPLFVKQLGAVIEDRNDAGFDGDGPSEWPVGTATNVSASYQGAPLRVFLRDRKGGDPSEWPEDLRIREFPIVNR